VDAIPRAARNKALAFGAAEWLKELPDLVSSVEQDWSILVGDPFNDATEAFVAQATLDDGTKAVLKLLVPRAGNAARNEIVALSLARGEGEPIESLTSRTISARLEGEFQDPVVSQLGHA
jgi:streptomycin 6-kinase